MSLYLVVKGRSTSGGSGAAGRPDGSGRTWSIRSTSSSGSTDPGRTGFRVARSRTIHWVTARARTSPPTRTSKSRSALSRSAPLCQVTTSARSPNSTGLSTTTTWRASTHVRPRAWSASTPTPSRSAWRPAASWSQPERAGPESNPNASTA